MARLNIQLIRPNLADALNPIMFEIRQDRRVLRDEIDGPMQTVGNDYGCSESWRWRRRFVDAWLREQTRHYYVRDARAQRDRHVKQYEGRWSGVPKWSEEWYAVRRRWIGNPRAGRLPAPQTWESARA